MNNKIVIWGASGHAKVLREFVGLLGYELIAVFDNDSSLANSFDDVPLFFGKEGFAGWQNSQQDVNTKCLVAIGGANGRARHDIQVFLKSNGIEPIVVVHPRAFVANNTKLSEGCQVLAHATVCTDVVMGEACIVNTAASVDHECILGNGVHIAPGATLAGCVRVGDYSLIGLGAVVLPRLTIGSNTIVGAGSIVTKDVPDGKVIYGNPARVQRDNFV